MPEPALERGSGVSLWRQIERTLAAEIASGVHQPGSRLPPELELGERFAVNRHTVRRAVSSLAQRGLLRVEQGRGTFVQENVIDYEVGRRTRFHENLARQKRAAQGQLLRSYGMPATRDAAKALEVRVGAPLLVLETLGEADGRPMSVAAHYFPAKRFAGLEEAYLATRSITKALERLGVRDYTRKVTRVTARMPTADEARLLAQPATRPILLAESVNIDSERKPIEYGLARFASDRVQLVFEP